MNTESACLLAESVAAVPYTRDAAILADRQYGLDRQIHIQGGAWLQPRIVIVLQESVEKWY